MWSTITEGVYATQAIVGHSKVGPVGRQPDRSDPATTALSWPPAGPLWTAIAGRYGT